MRDTVPFFGRGGQGDDGLAARRARRAAVEVRLAADAGVELGAERVGAHLAGEVDLEGGVDGHHLVLLADDERVVDVLGGVEREQGVVVDVVVELLGAHAEAGDDLAPVGGLLGAGDDAGLDQVDDGVGEHLGVDAEVLLLLEELDHRVGDAADAHLEGGAVLHERGDVLADGRSSRSGPSPVGLVGEGVCRLDERLVHRDEDVEVVDVHEAVAQGPRHLRVDLGDHEAGVRGGHLTMSTEMPRLQRPCSSGGVTWIRATSSGIWPLANRPGMSERKMGV